MLQDILFWISAFTLYIMLSVFANAQIVKFFLNITIKSLSREISPEMRYYYLLTYGWMCSVIWGVVSILIAVVVALFWGVW